MLASVSYCNTHVAEVLGIAAGKIISHEIGSAESQCGIEDSMLADASFVASVFFSTSARHK